MNRAELEAQTQAIRSALQGIYQKIKSQRSAIFPTPDSAVIGAGEYIQQEQYSLRLHRHLL